MKQLPREQRPYEKCFMQGEGSLNDTELLAVILRSGTSGKNSLALAQEILKFMESSSYPGLMGLMHVSVQDLMKIHVILHQVRMTYRSQPGFIRRGNCWEYICWIIL